MMKRILYLSVFLSICHSSARAQVGDFYDSYISGRMDIWKINMDQLECDYLANQSYEVLLDLTIAQYGYIAYCMSAHQKKMASEYVIKAEENAEKMLKLNPEWARAHALMGAIIGFKVGQTPILAPLIGLRAVKEVEKASVMDPGDPNIWMEKGNVDLYKPAIFGGNKDDAIGYYLKAIELFESNHRQVKKNWLYLNSLSGLATAYVKTNQIQKANQIYLKILLVEPEFKWIRDDVYPDFKLKHGIESL